MRQLAFAFVVSSAWYVNAQCPFPITADFQLNCSTLGNGHVIVGVNGGTAPFQIVIERFDPLNNQYVQAAQVTGVLGSNTISQNTQQWFNRNQARVRVTDANNCVVQNVYFFQSIGTRQFSLAQVVDCNTGQTFGDVGISWGGGNVPVGTYNWDFGASQSFTGNWTTDGMPIAGGFVHYRSLAAVTPGSHSLVFPQYNTSSFQYCQDWIPYTFQAITTGDCGVNFRLRAALDGAVGTSALMSDSLRAHGLVPLTQPYSALGYTLVGSPANVSVSPALLAVTGNDAVVDWVIVELRSSTTTVAYSKPALLQRDGDVVDADGDTYLNFPVTAGSYRVAVRHRNHLGVMTNSALAVVVNPATVTVDLRNGSSATYGTNALVFKNGVNCLWAGDATGNGTVAYTGAGNDRDPQLQAVGSTTPNNALSNVYDRRDTNLDGVIKYTGANNDRDIILTNVGSTTPNNTRTQQLP